MFRNLLLMAELEKALLLAVASCTGFIIILITVNIVGYIEDWFKRHRGVSYLQQQRGGFMSEEEAREHPLFNQFQQWAEVEGCWSDQFTDWGPWWDCFMAGAGAEATKPERTVVDTGG